MKLKEKIEQWYSNEKKRNICGNFYDIIINIYTLVFVYGATIQHEYGTDNFVKHVWVVMLILVCGKITLYILVNKDIKYMIKRIVWDLAKPLLSSIVCVIVCMCLLGKNWIYVKNAAIDTGYITVLYLYVFVPAIGILSFAIAIVATVVHLKKRIKKQ